MSGNTKHLVVLISGNGSNLQSIIDRIDAGKINAQIRAVISNRADAFGLQRAKSAGIESICLSHNDYTSREEYDQALAKQIEQYDPDLIVLAGFMRILSPNFVNQFQGIMLNIHPSLLPKYKGLHTHKRAIEAKESEHGASIHFVTAELDGGPVVIQSKVPLFATDTEQQLAARVQEQERQIYPLVVDWFCQNRLKMQNNRAYLDGELISERGYAAE